MSISLLEKVIFDQQIKTNVPRKVSETRKADVIRLINYILFLKFISDQPIISHNGYEFQTMNSFHPGFSQVRYNSRE